MARVLGYIFRVAFICGANGFSQRPGSVLDQPNSVSYHRAAGVAPGKCTKRIDPTILFIGQPHSGTTSLAMQMSEHPQLSFGTTKEHQYFNRGCDFSDDGFRKYQDEFWVSCDVEAAFDASPGYVTIANSGACGKSGLEAVSEVRKRLGRKVKIIVMLRDPVELLFSKYCSTGKHTDPFIDKSEFNATHEWSNVSDALAVWSKVFPNKRNWLYLNSEQYFARPESVVNQVFEFAGVREKKLGRQTYGVNEGRRRCSMRPTPKEREIYYSNPANLEKKKNLERMTGLSFHWDKVSGA